MKTNLLDFTLPQLTDHFAAMGEKMFGHLDADGNGSLEKTELARGKMRHEKGARER